MSSPLQYAFRALSLNRIGRLSNDGRLITNSLNAYGKALKYLQKALWDPIQMWDDQTFVAAKIMFLYEVCIDFGTASDRICSLNMTRLSNRLHNPSGHGMFMLAVSLI